MRAPASQAEAMEALNLLFHTYPNFAGSVEGVAVYAYALRNSSKAAIDMAVSRIVDGEAEDIDPRFMPPAPQLAQYVRYCETLVGLPPARQIAPPEPEPEFSTEHRVMMIARFRALTRRMAGELGVVLPDEPDNAPETEDDAHRARVAARVKVTVRYAEQQAKAAAKAEAEARIEPRVKAHADAIRAARGGLPLGQPLPNPEALAQLAKREERARQALRRSYRSPSRSHLRKRNHA